MLRMRSCRPRLLLRLQPRCELLDLEISSSWIFSSLFLCLDFFFELVSSETDPPRDQLLPALTGSVNTSPQALLRRVTPGPKPNRHSSTTLMTRSASQILTPICLPGRGLLLHRLNI